MANATVKQVKEFFDTPERPMTLKEMKAEWIGSDESDPTKKLTDEDKRQIMEGIGNGSLNY